MIPRHTAKRISPNGRADGSTPFSLKAAPRPSPRLWRPRRPLRGSPAARRSRDPGAAGARVGSPPTGAGLQPDPLPTRSRTDAGRPQSARRRAPPEQPGLRVERPRPGSDSRSAVTWLVQLRSSGGPAGGENRGGFFHLGTGREKIPKPRTGLCAHGPAGRDQARARPDSSARGSVLPAARHHTCARRRGFRGPAPWEPFLLLKSRTVSKETPEDPLRTPEAAPCSGSTLDSGTWPGGSRLRAPRPLHIPRGRATRCFLDFAFPLEKSARWLQRCPSSVRLSCAVPKGARSRVARAEGVGGELRPFARISLLAFRLPSALRFPS